jgi:hypothetical protein
MPFLKTTSSGSTVVHTTANTTTPTPNPTAPHSLNPCVSSVPLLNNDNNNATQVAPYLTLLLNGAGWSPSFPQLMTNEQLTVALDRAHTLGGARFTNIGDISCDVEVGFLINVPFYNLHNLII